MKYARIKTELQKERNSSFVIQDVMSLIHMSARRRLQALSSREFSVNVWVKFDMLSVKYGRSRNLSRKIEQRFSHYIM